MKALFVGAMLSVALVLGAGPALAASEAVTAAQALLNQGQYQQALDAIEKHLESSPQDAEARFTRGLTLVRLNRSDDAIQAFSDITRDYPQLPEPYNNLAVLYAQRGEYEQARDALEGALANHPSYTIAHENLGDIYAALATAAYRRAVSLDPDNQPARSKLNLVAQLDGLADSGAAVPAAPQTTAAAAKTEAAPAAALTADADAAVRQRINDWAAAWSSQDATRYLSFYSDRFVPEGGASRAAWAELRTTRVTRPDSIKVVVSDLQLTTKAADHLQAEFKQDYTSNLLTNRATKVLEFKNQDGNWRIVREYSR